MINLLETNCEVALLNLMLSKLILVLKNMKIFRKIPKLSLNTHLYYRKKKKSVHIHDDFKN